MRTRVSISVRRYLRAIVLIAFLMIITVASTGLRADTGTCGGQMTTLPFTDVSAGSVFFCSIAEAFFTGLSNGTTSTTYSPSDPVLREQMAAFVTRTMDQSVKRSSRRAASNQYWTTQGAANLGLTNVGISPQLVQSDGADLWLANTNTSTVSRVRASDGRLLETWTGAIGAFGVLSAMGKIFVTGENIPGTLYQIDPSLTAGAVTVLSSSLGDDPTAIAYDGQRIWTANVGSVSIISLNPTSVTNVSTGFISLNGVVYDGANIWVTDGPVHKLHKLNSGGAILLSVDVGTNPFYLGFDGTNIWVPNQGANTVSVVREQWAASQGQCSRRSPATG